VDNSGGSDEKDRNDEDSSDRFSLPVWLDVLLSLITRFMVKDLTNKPRHDKATSTRFYLGIRPIG